MKELLVQKNQMEQLKGSIFLFCAFTLAGTSVVSARFVSGRLGTFTITVVSLFFAVLCLLPLCAGKLAGTIRVMRNREWLMLTLQALFGIFLFRIFLLQGLLRTHTGEAGILTGTTPAVTAILAILILKEPAGIKKIIGISCTIGGILLIQGVMLPGSRLTAQHFWGNMLVICAAACESIFNILSRINHLKKLSQHQEELNPLVQTFIVSGIALLLCIVPALLEQPIAELRVLGLKEWLALVWYGVFVTALAFIFWYSGIKRRSAYAAAAFSGMMPFTSLFLSVTLLGEHAGWEQWSGGALIVLGMILIGDKHAGKRLYTVKTGTGIPEQRDMGWREGKDYKNCNQ